MSGPYIVRLTGPSGEHRYYAPYDEVPNIRDARNWLSRRGAQNKADALREQYGRARIQTEVAVIDLSA